jgi:hypothetical protein
VPARVIEGETPASRGERPGNGPMICGGEFSGEILLLFFFTQCCFGISRMGSWLWRPNVVLVSWGLGGDKGSGGSVFMMIGSDGVG